MKKWKKYANVHLILLFIGVIFVIVLYKYGKKIKKDDLKTVFDKVEESTTTVEKFDPSVLTQKRRKKINLNEERCRQIFETFFNKPFPSVRPDFLKNPITGKNLELDGFNATIRTPIGKGLAFEYDGAQHAQYSPHFHKDGAEEFRYQQQKDFLKSNTCRKLGITLIRIPASVSKEMLSVYIANKLKIAGININGEKK